VGLRSGFSEALRFRASRLCLDARVRRSFFQPTGGDGHFIGVVRMLDRVCAKAELEQVTPHVLRHTFASVAGDLGFSELTIAGLLGHSARGVTQGYVHLDTALVVAANRVSVRIAELLDGNANTARRRRGERAVAINGLVA
jgi:integrase